MTPVKAANHISKILDAICKAHGDARFPVDVERLALGCGEIFQWDDRIIQVQSAAIKGFEGCLFKGEKGWLLLYNEALTSRGRVRFTQAHELGHYVLHRTLQDEFRCTAENMLEWAARYGKLESEADQFASYILMPLNDFRAQLQCATDIDLEVLGDLAERYGVSLTSAILKWLEFTDRQAVLILSTDGFMNWSVSSEPAFKAGAFFKTRSGPPVPVSAYSLAANESAFIERQGIEIPARTWFRHANEGDLVREMKISSDQYGNVLTLLSLPKNMNAWPSRVAEESSNGSA
jgi:Zn-dependent peptidase ImmA (M78 family)